MANDPLLKLDHVSVSASGRKLVDDVTLELERGKLVALIGPNGAGKTTLLRAILGLVKYDGEITINAPVGYVPQRLQYDRTLPMTVLEFMALTLQKRPVAFGIPARVKRRVLELLDTVGAARLARSSLGGLSGGELQRVMFASALQESPKLLLLDEPAAGVDIEGEATFHELILNQVREHGATVVLVSHDLSVVSDITDQVVCLNKTLRCVGSAHDLLTAETIAEVFGGHKAVYGHHHH
ncbi:MAG: metal ABC transporter ATP-binding protein [Planctomycetes bacterium]|nr:metal ABC transporter ATP-binding protein [Planctomycetota bacterium]MCA8936143.1 metal ABC transporter ATP-binding protein [Planctomycetota bacterium]